MTKLDAEAKFVNLPKLQQGLRLHDTSPATFNDTSLMSVSKSSFVQNSVSLSKDFTQASIKQRSHATVQNAKGRYGQGMIPTENLKLEQFLEILFGSKMTSDQMRHETIQYVRILETNYNERIKTLQQQLEKLRKHAQSDRVKNVGKDVEKRDLEQLFVDCVEEVRKEIVRRRLKNEFANRRKAVFARS